MGEGVAAGAGLAAAGEGSVVLAVAVEGEAVTVGAATAGTVGAVAAATAGLGVAVGLGILVACHYIDSTDVPFAIVNRTSVPISIRVFTAGDEWCLISTACTKFIADVRPNCLVKFNPLTSADVYKVKVFEKDWHPWEQFSKELATRDMVRRGEILEWNGSSI